MRQRLARGRGVVGCLAGGIEVGELVRGLLVLFLDLVGNGACGTADIMLAMESSR